MSSDAKPGSSQIGLKPSSPEAKGTAAHLFPGVLAATRLHLPADEQLPEVTLHHLRKYIEQALALGVHVAIAVNAHEVDVRRIAKEVSPSEGHHKVHVLSVPCWGIFVPALNALLGFAQRFGMTYIMYSSLEVLCSPAVLQLLIDHHSMNTLVVGPELQGHDFEPGERALNGRTVPWNTLALWNVRKLALTGFLSIADGLGSNVSNGAPPPTTVKQRPKAVSLDLDSDSEEPNEWWNFERGITREVVAQGDVPAGVEEVTAVAILQHLHGRDQARAILVQLPQELANQTSWSASWGKDERRAQWHAYKMASKVSRPAAQLKQLFPGGRGLQNSQLFGFASGLGDVATGIRKRLSSKDSSQEPQSPASSVPEPSKGPNAGPEHEDNDSNALTFGVVSHYTDSIPPPGRVKWLCLMSFGLFSMNFTSPLATAFTQLNAKPAARMTPEWATLLFVGVLVGGVYFPMPLALWLTQSVTKLKGHRGGMMLIGAFLLFAHGCVVLAHALPQEGLRPFVIITARLIQGLGSGVLFLARFVLASVSTSDQHMGLQSWSFLANDLGLGIGALLPALTSTIPGCEAMSHSMPELLPSVVLAAVSFAYIVGIAWKFPASLPTLSDSVRFRNHVTSAEAPVPRSRIGTGRKSSRQSSPVADTYRTSVWVSGTTRVFVQSAIMLAVALSMRDAGWTGSYRQTYAVSALCLLPMPFEVLAAKAICSCSGVARLARDGTSFSKLASGAFGFVALLAATLQPRSIMREENGEVLTLLTRVAELVVLMIALGMAAPFNASRLYQLQDAEYATAMLEWMKAYIGRLFGPIFAIFVYSWMGYGTLLAVLCGGTAVVALTA